jgi:hypothetical protein
VFRLERCRQCSATSTHAVEGLINGVPRFSTWLTGRFTLFGATFQNWMLVAIAIVLVGVLIAWWRQQ